MLGWIALVGCGNDQVWLYTKIQTSTYRHVEKFRPGAISNNLERI